MTVRQTGCRFCDLDIEGFAPYRRGEWRDRGNNSTCPHGPNKGKPHAPYMSKRVVGKLSKREEAEQLAAIKAEMRSPAHTYAGAQRDAALEAAAHIAEKASATRRQRDAMLAALDLIEHTAVSGLDGDKEAALQDIIETARAAKTKAKGAL